MDFETTKHDEEHAMEEVNMILSHGALMCNNGHFFHIWEGEGGGGGELLLAPEAKLKTWFFGVACDMPTHKNGKFSWSSDV